MILDGLYNFFVNLFPSLEKGIIKSVKILNEQYNRYNTNYKDNPGIKVKDIITLDDNSESNEPKKYIRITKS